MSDKAVHRSLAVLIFIVGLIVYVMTMAATVSFWDCGEFIATSYILGIPHSPGTPLYVLVGRVFCLLPVGLSIAEKVNLLSALSAALGVLMAYLAMVYSVRFMFGRGETARGRFIRYAGPLTGSFFLMFSDTYWTNAVEAEVYALSTFVMGLCTVLALRWLNNPSCELDPAAREKIIDEAGRSEGKRLIEIEEEENRKHSRNLILLIVYLLALGIGFHLGTIVVYGGIFLMLLMVKEKAFSNAELIAFTFGFAVVVADMTLHKQTNLTIIGLVLWGILVAWTAMTRGKFALTATVLFILGVSVHIFLMIRSHLDPELDMVDPESWRALYFHLRREQYPPMTPFLRRASIAFQLDQFGRYFSEQFRLLGDYMAGPFNLGKASIIIPAALGLFGVGANYMREKRTWVLNFTNLAVNTAGMLLLLNFSDHEPRERDYFYGPGFYFFAIFIGIGASSLLMLLADQVKETGRDLKRFVVPAGVILIILSIIPSGYQWFRHDRSNNYLARDYAYNMLASLEPDAILVTNGDNDTYPLWYIQSVEGFRRDVRVMNRMLLNTPWYVKQIRDQHPRVPINLTDLEIERLRPIRNPQDGSIIWTYARVLDHVVRNTNWKRPIYFGVTVPQEVWGIYSDYLVMEGMVRKLIPLKGKYMVNDYQMARNLDDIFVWRGVLDEGGKYDDSIYKSQDVVTMYQNYSVATMQLAFNQGTRGLYDEAIRWGEMSFQISPDFQWGRKELGIYYMRDGRFEEAADYYRRQIGYDSRNGDYWLGLAAVYETIGDVESSLRTLREAASAVPDYKDIFRHGFQMAAVQGRREEAIWFIRTWIESHPADRDFNELYRDIDRVINELSGRGAGADTTGE